MELTVVLVIYYPFHQINQLNHFFDLLTSFIWIVQMLTIATTTTTTTTLNYRARHEDTLIKVIESLQK